MKTHGRALLESCSRWTKQTLWDTPALLWLSTLVMEKTICQMQHVSLLTRANLFFLCW